MLPRWRLLHHALADDRVGHIERALESCWCSARRNRMIGRWVALLALALIWPQSSASRKPERARTVYNSRHADRIRSCLSTVTIAIAWGGDAVKKKNSKDYVSAGRSCSLMNTATVFGHLVRRQSCSPFRSNSPRAGWAASSPIPSVLRLPCHLALLFARCVLPHGLSPSAISTEALWPGHGARYHVVIAISISRLDARS